MGFAYAQSSDPKITSATRDYFPEDSVQLYRTTYTLSVEGSAKIKSIASIRVEDWTIEFDKLDKKLKLKPGKPLNIVVNCMENRRAKRTEWMLSAWFGPTDASTNLFVVHSERMKNGHGDLPDVEIVLVRKSDRLTLRADLPQ
jgi:hypothetical protein